MNLSSAAEVTLGFHMSLRYTVASGHVEKSIDTRTGPQRQRLLVTVSVCIFFHPVRRCMLSGKLWSKECVQAHRNNVNRAFPGLVTHWGRIVGGQRYRSVLRCWCQLGPDRKTPILKLLMQNSHLASHHNINSNADWALLSHECTNTFHWRHFTTWYTLITILSNRSGKNWDVPIRIL